jgi:hypothetical protein
MLPVVLSGALILWAFNQPALPRSNGPHVRALVARWSMAEGVAILIAFYLFDCAHHPERMFTAGAVIVGLHFLPLARGIPIRLYYATGAGIILVGLCSLLLPAGDRPATVGLGVAAMLWASFIARVQEQRRAPTPA